jgi:hypothetical protein
MPVSKFKLNDYDNPVALAVKKIGGVNEQQKSFVPVNVLFSNLSEEDICDTEGKL